MIEIAVKLGHAYPNMFGPDKGKLWTLNYLRIFIRSTILVCLAGGQQKPVKVKVLALKMKEQVNTCNEEIIYIFSFKLRGMLRREKARLTPNKEKDGSSSNLEGRKGRQHVNYGKSKKESKL